MFAHKLQWTDQKTPQTWIKNVNRILDSCFRYLGVSFFTSSLWLEKHAIFSTKGELLFIMKLEGLEVWLPWGRVGSERKCHWCSTPEILLSWNISSCCSMELKGLIGFQLLPGPGCARVETHLFFHAFLMFARHHCRVCGEWGCSTGWKLRHFWLIYVGTPGKKRHIAHYKNVIEWVWKFADSLLVMKDLQRLDDCMHRRRFSVCQPLAV